MIISIVLASRQHLSELFWWYVEQIGKREGEDRFDM